MAPRTGHEDSDRDPDSHSASDPNRQLASMGSPKSFHPTADTGCDPNARSNSDAFSQANSYP